MSAPSADAVAVAALVLPPGEGPGGGLRAVQAGDTGGTGTIFGGALAAAGADPGVPKYTRRWAASKHQADVAGEAREVGERQNCNDGADGLNRSCAAELCPSPEPEWPLHEVGARARNSGQAWLEEATRCAQVEKQLRHMLQVSRAGEKAFVEVSEAAAEPPAEERTRERRRPPGVGDACSSDSPATPPGSEDSTGFLSASSAPLNGTAASPRATAVGTGEAAIACCIADIEAADFVALDLEFSGLFLNFERDFRPMEAYFRKCVDSIPSFLVLQLGICCAKRRPADGIWEMRAHEFNLWPRNRGSSIFSADLASLMFLHQHGFDFNAFFRHHYEYDRLPSQDAEDARGEPVGAARVVAALRAARVPLVVHNGLLDVLHLFDKFVGELPNSSAGFGEAWVAQFPFLFDTRHIAQEGRHGLRYEGRLELNELHQHMQGLSCTSKCEHLGPLAADRPTHGSSGKDATITAEVFLLALEVMMREALTSVTTLRTHRLCRRFHNRVAIMSTSDAVSLHLGNPPGILLVPPLLCAAMLPKPLLATPARGSPPAPPPVAAAAVPSPVPPPPPPPERSPTQGAANTEVGATAAPAPVPLTWAPGTWAQVPPRPEEMLIPKPRWA